MVDKAVNLSAPKYLEENIAIIQETLLNNHYPLDFINTYIRKRLEFLKKLIISKGKKPEKNESSSEKTLYITTSFVNQVAPKLNRVS